MRSNDRQAPADAGRGGARPWIARWAGTLVAVFAALFVGALLTWGARGQDLPADPVRAFGLLPGFLVGGLLLDIWQARAPTRGLEYLRRACYYWAVAFPLARLVQDLLAFAYYRAGDPDAELAALFPALASPGALGGWLLFQAVFGAGYGFGFGMLARRLANWAARRRD